MRIAITSEDFSSVTGKPGRARRFLVFQAVRGAEPELMERLELPAGSPDFHALHDDEETPHPLDGAVLVTAEAGEGFEERLARRGIAVYITSETDPVSAARGVVDGSLPILPPSLGDCANG